ncbi:hypothetical protein B0H14DRAFT_3126181 [Mycena olivaceomarginata]|nr:hypothetical protein B0H14DRAFT_3126181 [Mycena olivaceomarginata]
MWVPPEYHTFLQLPPRLIVIGSARVVVDMSRVVHGTDWVKCYIGVTTRISGALKLFMLTFTYDFYTHDLLRLLLCANVEFLSYFRSDAFEPRHLSQHLRVRLVNFLEAVFSAIILRSRWNGVPRVVQELHRDPIHRQRVSWVQAIRSGHDSLACRLRAHAPTRAEETARGRAAAALHASYEARRCRGRAPSSAVPSFSAFRAWNW